MKIIGVYLVALVLGLEYESQCATKKGDIENGIFFEILCHRVQTTHKLTFVIKITNYTKDTIKVPRTLIVVPNYEKMEGNIGFELEYIRSDTMKISDSIGIDLVPAIDLYKKKEKLGFRESYLKEISLPFVDDTKKGKYRIRFYLRGVFIEPRTTDIPTDWYYFQL